MFRSDDCVLTEFNFVLQFVRLVKFLCGHSKSCCGVRLSSTRFHPATTFATFFAWVLRFRSFPRGEMRVISLVSQGAFAIARKVSYRVRKFKGVCCPLIFMFGVVEQCRSIFSWGWKILYRGLVGAKFLSPGFRKSMTLFRLCLHFEWESQLVPNNTVLRFHDALLGFSFPKVRLCFAISVKAWSHI